MSDIRQEKAHCHCGTISVIVSFLSSRLPFEHCLCHCNTCRHVEGQTAFYFLPIEGPPLFGGVTFNPVASSISDFTAYRTSPTSVRYFCHTCSATVLRCDNDKEWFVSGGCVDKTDDIARLSYHMHVADTMDGGMANQIPDVDGRVLPRYAYEKGSEELPMTWRSEKLKPIEEAKTEPCLSGYCHCGAIQFNITRPNILSTIPQAPYPDLYCPRLQSRLSTRRNAKDVKWWLHPPIIMNHQGDSTTPENSRIQKGAISGETRYVAGYCTCETCRLSGGFEAQGWIWVPCTNIFEKGSTEHVEFFHEPSRPRHLMQYLSSPGRFREFCGICGATAFWWYAGRPDIIDIAAGLLDQNIDGVRAEGWVKWYTQRLGFMETAKYDEKSILRGLKHGMESFQEHASQEPVPGPVVCI